MLEKEIRRLEFKGNISTNINIGKKTAFKTSGMANYFIEPADKKSLSTVIRYLKDCNESFFVLGGGYNTLVSENGINTVVSLKKFFNKFEILEKNNNEILINIQAGALLQKICWFCAFKGFIGLNPLIGIPGTIGGAVFMNAGTKDGDIFSVLEEIDVMDYKGENFRVKKNDIIASYRELKVKNIKDFIITGCTLKLKKNNAKALMKEAKNQMTKRKSLQPVKEKSCGCFFKNPVNNSPAGMLIEKAGLKGKKIGGAKVSEIHANFIVNENNCSASHIIELKELIEKEVKKKFNVILEPEVKIVGR
ncbi:MAG: UDP-N-acetylmuramate dehydrogenase [Desulfobacteraceae bacterium]|nr:UDP-N-acetylmuramate dehydrogenase [Desulfobacteraceae bacterium]